MGIYFRLANFNSNTLGSVYRGTGSNEYNPGGNEPYYNYLVSANDRLREPINLRNGDRFFVFNGITLVDRVG